MTDISIDSHDVERDESLTNPGPAVAAALKEQDAAPATDVASPNKKPTGSLYSIVWRWHFYAGLLTIPVLWIVTITGALYVFRTELTDLRDRELLYVEPTEQRKSYEELKQVAIDAHGSEEIEGLIVYPDSSRSIQFVGHVDLGGEQEEEQGGHQHAQHNLIYLDPYTGQVLGSRIDEHDFFYIVLQLHRNLMLGTTGRVLTELMTCWGIILLATGVFLWWPRGKKNVGVWLPRIRGKLYPILRDWHAVASFYMVPLVLLVAGTGLFFSPLMGSAFNATAQKAGHWPVQEWFRPPQSKPAAEGTPPATLDQVVPTILAQSRPGDAVRIRLTESPEQAYRAFLIQDEDKNSYRSVDVDQYTGELSSVVNGYDLKLLYRIRLWAVSIHMGQIFGTPTKILALLSTLTMFALSITGLWMWWVRRPKGRTGFPRRPSRLLPSWGWAVVVMTAILLPTAGISFIVVGLIDWMWGRVRRTSLPAQ